LDNSIEQKDNQIHAFVNKISALEIKIQNVVSHESELLSSLNLSKQTNEELSQEINNNQKKLALVIENE
jgi:hypothetical protein